jgi:hypothetical protein
MDSVAAYSIDSETLENIQDTKDANLCNGETLQTFGATQQIITAISDEVIDNIQEQQYKNPLTSYTFQELAEEKTKLKDIELGLHSMHANLLT